MQNNRNLVIGVILLFIGVAGLYGLSSRMLRMPMGGMMGGGNMKAMMQTMMGAQLPPGINPDKLPDPASNGAQLLGQYCTQCHRLPSPGMHTAKEWPQVVARMNRRMQMMSNRGMMRMMSDIRAPSNSELKILVAYLQKHALQTINRAQYTDLNSPAGKLFSTVCSRCHALPNPEQHTAAEWPGVVKQMTQNRKMMGKTLPSHETLETIVVYLQKYAK